MLEFPRRAAVGVALPIAAAVLIAPFFDAASAVADPDPTASGDVQFELTLDLQDVAGAQALATAVSTPGGPQYRHFVSPSDWIARFAPTQASFDAATQQLSAAGLTVAAAQPADREFVIGSGPASVVAQVFATPLRTEQVAGATRIAAVRTPHVPAALRHLATSVSIGRAPAKSQLVRADSRSTTGACSTYWQQHTVAFPRSEGLTRASTRLCGYTPAQLRQVTGLDAAHGVRETGSGVTVAVLDAFGETAGITADLASFSTRNRLPQAPLSTLVPDASTWAQSDGCRATDWQDEQMLDIEAVHSVAPRASLLYVGAADCEYGLDLGLSEVLDGGLADIVSNSFSVGESMVQDAEVHQQLQAAGEGIALVAASGDDGDEVAFTGTGAVGFPASSTWVTAAGGTTVALDAAGRRVFDLPWGEDIDLGVIRGRSVRWTSPLPGQFAQGAGGGRSALFAQPWYQSAAVPAALSSGARTTADVAALASGATGFREGFTRIGGRGWTEEKSGGTSLSSPIVAAEAALAEQRAGHRLGFLNPSLYAASSTFRDVRASNVRRVVAVRSGSLLELETLGQDSSLAARRGYDLSTGLGEFTPATIAALARG